MREQVLETEAVEMPDLEGEESEFATRPLPATVDGSSDVSAWRGGVGSAVAAAAGGLVAGAATVAVVRATRGGSSGRKPVKRSGRGQRPQKVVASRSFLVDVHLLGDK